MSLCVYFLRHIFSLFLSLPFTCFFVIFFISDLFLSGEASTLLQTGKAMVVMKLIYVAEKRHLERTRSLSMAQNSTDYLALAVVDIFLM
jgi:hypothetical protein